MKFEMYLFTWIIKRFNVSNEYIFNSNYAITISIIIQLLIVWVKNNFDPYNVLLAIATKYRYSHATYDWFGGQGLHMCEI